jgi:hypothetical protein
MVSTSGSILVPAAVSPDRTRIAYLDGALEPERLFIVDATGTDHPVPGWPVSRSWATIAWPNDHSLILGEYWLMDGSAFALDPESGDLALIPPSFPITSDDGELRGGQPAGLPFAYYNSAMDLVAVPRYLEAEDRHTVELRSLPNGDLLWKGASWGVDPIWSPDGRSLVVILRSEPDDHDCAILALVDHEGRETSLDECVWLGASWSPDGNTIAAWKPGNGSACPEGLNSGALMLLDLESYSKRTLRICADQSRAGITIDQQPIWSPDGNYIVVNRYDYRLEPVDSLLIDLADNKAYVIPGAMEVAAWIW